jgi:hypothetical protein
MTGTAAVQAAFAAAPGFVQVTNPLRLVDNASGAQASIKAASTNPAITDTALVTAIADGNHVTIGAKADAANTATNTTPITAMSVWKQISASVQAIATWTGTAISVATHAVTQSGTWTVQPGNTANTTAWKVDGSAVTQPVSLASVPSHAVTNAGTFAVQSSIADGFNTVEGAVADAAVTAGATGSISAKLRAISRDIVANIVLAAGSNLIGRAVSDASAAIGGIASTARLASAAASTNATNVKATAGRIYSISGKNNAPYDVFLVLYDATTNPPVPGTTAIRKKIVCPAGQVFVYDWPVGLSFATGIGYAFTKLVADADTTPLVAADITAFNLDYV